MTTRRMVPAAVDRAICKALAQHPADRFSTAAEFARELDEVRIDAGSPLRTRESQDLVVAVLPFTNLSADPEAEYFSDGITEEIINAPSNLSGLCVTARTSSFAFKGKTSDIREIGNKLGVGAVIEGSVRRAGNRLRITAQLVDVDSGLHVWSDKYDRELEDVFAIQDEIAGSIAGRFKRDAAPRAARPDRPTENFEAYDAYLRGRFHWNKGTPDAYRQAIEHLEGAIALDPRFAQAYLGIAEVFCNSPIFGAHPREVFPRARTMVQRALEIDDTLADGHAVLAYINFWFDWQWEEAELGFKRAIELNANSATAHNYYSVFLANLGRPEEAVVHSRKTLDLDPLWVNARQIFQWALCCARRYDESLAEGRRALEISPGYKLAEYTNGAALLEIGRLEAARACYESTAAGGNGFALAGLSRAYALLDRRAEAVQVAARVDALVEAGTGAPSWAA